MARRFALVPLGPPLLAYRSNCKAMLTAVDGAVQLVVDRPYKAGESIVVWYDFLSLNIMLLATNTNFSFLYSVSFKNLKYVSFAGVDHSLTQNCF